MPQIGMAQSGQNETKYQSNTPGYEIKSNDPKDKKINSSQYSENP